VPGPYFNFGAAKISVNRQSIPLTANRSDETWDIKANDGSALRSCSSLNAGYRHAAKSKRKSIRPRSPNFIVSTSSNRRPTWCAVLSMGLDRATKFNIKASGRSCAVVRRHATSGQHHVSALLFANDLYPDT
jgi:hypothetical protein